MSKLRFFVEEIKDGKKYKIIQVNKNFDSITLEKTECKRLAELLTIMTRNKNEMKKIECKPEILKQILEPNKEYDMIKEQLKDCEIGIDVFKKKLVELETKKVTLQSILEKIKR
jgi:hypothetical protein